MDPLTMLEEMKGNAGYNICGDFFWADCPRAEFCSYGQSLAEVIRKTYDKWTEAGKPGYERYSEQELSEARSHYRE